MPTQDISEQLLEYIIINRCIPTNPKLKAAYVNATPDLLTQIVEILEEAQLSTALLATVDAPSNTKDQILAFCRQHNKRPSTHGDSKEEVYLARAMFRYISPKNSGSDEAFTRQLDAVCPKQYLNQITEATKVGLQENILDFCRKNSKRPSARSSDANEVALSYLMQRFIYSSKKDFDPVFRDTLDAVCPKQVAPIRKSRKSFLERIQSWLSF